MENKKLKILNLVGKYYPDIGGTEQECRNLAKQFNKDGHQCTVLTAYKESLPSFERIEGIPVYRKIRGWHFYETTYIISIFLLLFKYLFNAKIKYFVEILKAIFSNSITVNGYKINIARKYDKLRSNKIKSKHYNITSIFYHYFLKKLGSAFFYFLLIYFLFLLFFNF